MARRSLQASTIGIEKAKRAFRHTQWTQEDLACEVGIETRQPIWKFFAGKPIERQTFLEICFRLGLDWQEIAALPTDSISTKEENENDERANLDTLVRAARSHCHDKIQAEYGAIRLLDTARPIELEDIYIKLDVFEDVTSNRRLDKSHLNCPRIEDPSCQSCNEVRQKHVSAAQVIETYSKLTILGKPGSGKTTLLQYIAIQCNRGGLFSDRLPIFIRLRSFAEDASKTQHFSLFSYISQELCKIGFSEPQIETLLHHGQALFLLDGLDEVEEEYRAEVQQQISVLSKDYDKNQFIVSCRTSTPWYWLEKFTDVEIADLNFSQVEAFAQQWFVNVSNNPREQGLVQADRVLKELMLPENQSIYSLVRTPLFLHLACSLFQTNLSFAAQHAELYKQALDILLVRWDRVRGIKPDKSLYQLSLPHKIKLLSQIAAITFEQDNYYFTQSNLLHYIKDYLRTLPNTPSDSEELYFISETVIRSLLVEHGVIVEQAQGIYSFSYPTFQEYFTARNIVANLEPEALNRNLRQLTIHMSDPRWHEVFLFVMEMIEDADPLIQLMQQRSDELVDADEKLQQFLIWLQQKSLSVEVPYEPAAVRAFYLSLELHGESEPAYDLSLSIEIDPRLTSKLTYDLYLDLALKRLLSIGLTICDRPSEEQILAIISAFPYKIDLDCHSKLQNLLEELREQLPNPQQSQEKLKEWWSTNGQTWVEEMRSQILWERNIGYQWQFSEYQKAILQQYYVAKYLVVKCLKKSREISFSVRAKIEETFLLPALLKVLHY
ncbi:NACHT domain-containing protein [Scytonema millei]|uniref:NACHT domain-containing NTPase n=1 Tax=Scytonema millei VB511283 TaxID=1245923 RepID=A0A9X5E8Y7_9CYAN|nr:NACHT domain-containing NTPase [Scytonema millei]NHC37417.1 NACHT domain-containing NTPase [Scytonema millei VB511283]